MEAKAKEDEEKDVRPKEPTGGAEETVTEEEVRSERAKERRSRGRSRRTNRNCRSERNP